MENSALILFQSPIPGRLTFQHEKKPLFLPIRPAPVGQALGIIKQAGAAERIIENCHYSHKFSDIRSH